MQLSRRKLLGLQSSGQNCPTQEDVLGQLAPRKADEDKILYWIDGFHLKNIARDGFYTPPESRATIQILVREPQTPNRWVDRVLLAKAAHDGDEVSNLKIYQQSEKLKYSGFPPYAIFHNLNLSESWRIYYRVVEGDKLSVFRTGRITDPDMTRFKAQMLHLPAVIRQEISISQFRGLFSCSYRLSVEAIQNRHLPESYIKSVQPNGYFVIEVEQTPLADHHIEMIFVTDPVGRILGLRKGPFTGPRTQIGALSTQEQSNLRLNSADIGNIHECPHVQVFVWNRHKDPEKKREGRLFRSIIWLR